MHSAVYKTDGLQGLLSDIGTWFSVSCGECESVKEFACACVCMAESLVTWSIVGQLYFNGGGRERAGLFHVLPPWIKGIISTEV